MMEKYKHLVGWLSIVVLAMYVSGYVFLILIGEHKLLDYYGSNMINIMIAFVLGIIVASYIKVQPYIKEIEELSRQMDELNKKLL